MAKSKNKQNKKRLPLPLDELERKPGPDWSNDHMM